MASKPATSATVVTLTSRHPEPRSLLLAPPLEFPPRKLVLSTFLGNLANHVRASSLPGQIKPRPQGAFPVDNSSFKKAEVAVSQVLAAEFLDTASDDSNQPARRWGWDFTLATVWSLVWAALPSLSQCGGGFPAKSKGSLSSLPFGPGALGHMSGGGEEYECGAGSTMGPPGSVQAIQGPYESGAELFSCIFQLPKSPRRAAVRTRHKHEQWPAKR